MLSNLNFNRKKIKMKYFQTNQNSSTSELKHRRRFLVGTTEADQYDIFV